MSTLVGCALLAAVLTPPAPPPLQESPPKPPTVAVKVGDPAPALAVEQWIKGEPLNSLEKGRVYVIDFWATWCGPCIGAMPHLTRLQKEYEGRSVTVIGVNTWDEPGSAVRFVESRPDLMGYHVAVERNDAGEKTNAGDRKGVMYRTWVAAAGRSGLPQIFIVDRDGRIAWFGHPELMKKPLQGIVAGTWDLRQAAAEVAATQRAEAQFTQYSRAMQAKEFDRAYAIGRELVASPLSDGPAFMAEVAWAIVDPSAAVADQDLDLALEASKLAVGASASGDSFCLATLARVHFCMSNTREAIEAQTKAIAVAPDDEQAALQAVLDEYRQASK